MENIRDNTHFQPTRQAALQRLAQFAPLMGQAYATKRNTDFGPEDRSNVSVLSPSIRHRLITEKEVLEKVLDHHSYSASEKFIQEVFWRSYFKGYLETRPGIWRDYKTSLGHLLARLEAESSLSDRYNRAVEGKTGIDCFDAWLVEMKTTGYLHNHARMWFASIWIFTLELPWQLGADLTYRNFIDGDPASNTLSWRWVGGLHTKGKTYLARESNIREYTNGRFNPQGLSHDAAALNEDAIYSAQPLPNIGVKAPSGPALFLLSEEDLSPESLDLGEAEVRAVVTMPVSVDRSPLSTSDRALGFSQSAVNDAKERATKHFEIPAETLETVSADSLVSLAKTHHVSRILTPYAPVGPVRDALTRMAPLLQQEGLELVMVGRREDQLIWPHASKGFFALKERIPSLLRELELAA